MEQELGELLSNVDAPAEVDAEIVDTTPEAVDTGETTTPPVVAEEDPREKGFQSALMDERRKRQAVEKELQEYRTKAEPPKTTDSPPNPNDFPGGEYDPAYFTALSRYEVRQEHARIRQEEATADRNRTAEQRFRNVEVNGYAKYPDYGQAIESLVSSGIRFSEVALEVITDSEYGHDITYMLSKNKQAAFELSKLSPSSQARELGKLEFKMQMHKPAETPKPEIPKPEIPKPEIPQTLTQQRDTRGQFVTADSGPPSLESILS